MKGYNETNLRVNIYCLSVSFTYGCNNIVLCFVKMPNFSRVLLL